MTDTMTKAADAIRAQIEGMMKSLNLPNIDMSTIIDGQKRTIDAMSKAAQLTNEAVTEIPHRQLEIFHAASEQLATTLKDLKLSDDQRRARLRPRPSRMPRRAPRSSPK